MSADNLSLFQRIKRLFLEPNIYPPLEAKTQQTNPSNQSSQPLNQEEATKPTQASSPEQPRKGPSLAEMAEQSRGGS